MRESRRPRIILGILLLVAFSLVAIDLRADANGPLGGVKSVTGSVLGPIESVASHITSPIRSFVSNLTSGGAKDAQIATLQARIAYLEAQGSSPETARRLGDLNDLLRMSQAGQYRMLPAQVIAEGSSQGFAHTITIDAGRRDGLTADMTVLARGGLAGRVVSVSTSTAVVVLLTDATTSVGGRLEGAAEIGFVSGTGSETELEFQLLDPYGQLRTGDRVVTFGSKSGRPYVPGVPIGEITEVTGTPGQLTRLAKVRPFVDMSTLDIVGVVTEPPRDNPRDSVLMPPGSSVRTVPVLPIPATGDSTSGGSTAAPTPAPTATTTPTPTPRPTGDGASPAAARP